mmetsp:Transcript_8066/g.20447  ORF Transcript_8066/g.20447 Transcript_8066/m.20447 type:complete len:227 (-) Transcript_8066:159-839(-)
MLSFTRQVAQEGHAAAREKSQRAQDFRARRKGRSQELGRALDPKLGGADGAGVPVQHGQEPRRGDPHGGHACLRPGRGDPGQTQADEAHVADDGPGEEPADHGRHGFAVLPPRAPLDRHHALRDDDEVLVEGPLGNDVRALVGGGQLCGLCDLPDHVCRDAGQHGLRQRLHERAPDGLSLHDVLFEGLHRLLEVRDARRLLGPQDVGQRRGLGHEREHGAAEVLER